MASTVLDSILFRDSFGTPQMRAVFDDRELIRKYVQVEVALATAEARCGVIPEAAAKDIAERCNADVLSSPPNPNSTMSSLPCRSVLRAGG